ncbi:MAG: hypothetical protein WAN23_11825 [Candidatus Acidiferrales bacterium]
MLDSRIGSLGMMVILLGGVVLFQRVPAAEAQAKPLQQMVVQLPQGALTRIPSPHGMWTLVFECPNDCSERKLWLESNASRARKLVGSYDRSLSVSWAPDGRSFFVDDEYGSNGTLSYVYDPITLKATDLATLIAANDAQETQFLKAGHSYLRATRWLSSHELLVVLYGHFDEGPPRGFTIQYRVDLKGQVKKLWQHSEEESQ